VNPINQFKILSLDQARNCGYAIADKGKIVEYGMIVSDISTTEEFDYVIKDIKWKVADMITKEKPLLVTIEAVYEGLNSDTHNKLSRMQGVLINYFIENQILYEIIKPSQWYGSAGLKGKSKKQQSPIKAREVFKDESIGSDTADAIWMCDYALNKIKVVFA